MRHSHDRHEPERQNINGTSLDLGLMIGELREGQRQIWVEVRRQGDMLAVLMRQREAPKPTGMQDAAEFVKLLLPICAIGLLIAGRIGAGDALAIFKIAFGGG